jgi:hypothetical protein
VVKEFEEKALHSLIFHARWGTMVTFIPESHDSRERGPGTLRIEDRISATGRLNGVAKKKNILSCRESNSGFLHGVKFRNTGNFVRVFVLGERRLFLQSVDGVTCPDVWEDKHDGKGMEWAWKTGRTRKRIS